MQTSILNRTGGLEELLNSMAPIRDLGVRKLKSTKFTDSLPKFNLNRAMNTAPARLLNDGVFGLPLKLYSSSGSSSQSASSELSSNKIGMFPVFNRTYTLEDQVRHKNFLEDAVNTFKKVEICAFCKRNGSPFFNHPLKDSRGGTVCPVLSRFTCKMCAATGRDAHTHKYCKNNPYTRGDPVAVGMAPGPSIKNPTKTPVKVDPSIDINDIYGVKKFTQSFKPVKRLDNTRALLFDENLRLNKKRKNILTPKENVGSSLKILQDKSRNKELTHNHISYNSEIYKTSQTLGSSKGGGRTSLSYGSGNPDINSNLASFINQTNYNQKWFDIYNQGLDSSLGKTCYASILKSSAPINLENSLIGINDLPASKKNNSKRNRRNKNKKNMDLSKTAGTISLGKELQALQRKVNKSTETLPVTLPSWF